MSNGNNLNNLIGANDKANFGKLRTLEMAITANYVEYALLDTSNGVRFDLNGVNGLGVDENGALISDILIAFSASAPTDDADTAQVLFGTQTPFDTAITSKIWAKSINGTSFIIQAYYNTEGSNQ